MGICFSEQSSTLAAFKKKRQFFFGNSHHIPCWVSGKMLLWGGHFRQLGSYGFTSCSNYIQVGEHFGSSMVTEVISKVFISVSWGSIPPRPSTPGMLTLVLFIRHHNGRTSLKQLPGYINRKQSDVLSWGSYYCTLWKLAKIFRQRHILGKALFWWQFGSVLGLYRLVSNWYNENWCLLQTALEVVTHHIVEVMAQDRGEWAYLLCVFGE